jgi:hypothetical protein
MQMDVEGCVCCSVTKRLTKAAEVFVGELANAARFRGFASWVVYCGEQKLRGQDDDDDSRSKRN